jgi:GNAT superfamily N-acetyltransferase
LSSRDPIELVEEPYDSAHAVALVTALNDEINLRYAEEVDEWSDEELQEDTDAYLAEVTPELVAPPNGVFVVARIAGEAVGCGAVKPFDRAAGIGEIKRMYTAPHARRRGISRAVLAHLESRARELGYERLQLETGTEQPEALALYEASGWERITPYGRYKDLPSSVCFGKDLVRTAPPRSVDRAGPIAT